MIEENSFLKSLCRYQNKEKVFNKTPIPPSTFSKTPPELAKPCPATKRLQAPLRQAVSNSQQISLLQWHINRILDVQIAVDGIFGPQTASKIAPLQQELNQRLANTSLVVDGIFGENTLKALDYSCYKIAVYFL